jgi:hypothetical protein
MAKPLYPGRIKVKTVLDPKFGEVYFEIEGSNVKNKCLYDALSEFGVELERAKDIVADLAKSTDSGKYYHMELIDYIAHGRKRREEAEEKYSTRLSSAEL